MSLFGSTLTVQDGFTRTLGSFIRQVNSANGSISGLSNRIRNAESSTNGSINRMRSQVSTLANAYRQAGLSSSEAFRRAWSDMERQSGNSINNIRNNLNGSGNSISSLTSKILKMATAWISVRSAVNLVKSSFKSAMEYQNASTFLQATYGESIGKEKFKWATQEANKTPFSESEVANGLARAKSLGLADDEKSFKMYEDLGSYAKIQGVGNLNSAIDAISDAKGGEWERLQTITGMKRKQLEEFADSKGIGKFTNKKGQVTDEEKLMEVIKASMDDKGITGMTDKFAKTMSGRLETLKGNFGKMLSDMVGIGDNGEIKEGSLFDNASKGLEKLIESVNKFAKSESFKIIEEGLSKLGNAIIKGFNYLTDHPEVAGYIVKIGGALLGLKVVSGLISPITNLTGLLGGSGGLGGIMGALNIKSVGLIAGLVGVGLAMHSLASKTGVLHNAFNNFMNGITNKQKGEQHDYASAIFNGVKYTGLEFQDGIAKLVGNNEWHKSLLKQKQYVVSEQQTADNELNGFYDETWGGADLNKVKWKDVRYYAEPKEESNTKENNKVEVNLNVDTVKETADINDIMDEISNRLAKATNTRNALDY